MKKSIIITVILAVIAIVTNAQTLSFYNQKATGYWKGRTDSSKEQTEALTKLLGGKFEDPLDLNIDSLVIRTVNDTTYISFSVTFVYESSFVEIPNYTYNVTVSNVFKRGLTPKTPLTDSKSYISFIYNRELAPGIPSADFYTVSITEYNDGRISYMISGPLNYYPFCAHFSIDTDNQ